MSDFFSNIKYASNLDDFFQREEHSSLVNLTTHQREKSALTLPVPAGTRVRFAFNLESVMAYSNLPSQDEVGSVIMVRTATGDRTGDGDHVFVKWDGGHYMVAHKDHLSLSDTRVASEIFQIHQGNSTIAQLFEPAPNGSDLIRKSTQDLWQVEEKNGSFMIRRLFAEDGEPLKA